MASLFKPRPIHIVRAQLTGSRVFAVVFNRRVVACHAQRFEHHPRLATSDHVNLAAVNTLVFKTSAQIVAYRIVTQTAKPRHAIAQARQTHGHIGFGASGVLGELLDLHQWARLCSRQQDHGFPQRDHVLHKR